MKKLLRNPKRYKREDTFRLTLKKSRELCLFGFHLQFRFKFCISR